MIGWRVGQEGEDRESVEMSLGATAQAKSNKGLLLFKLLQDHHGGLLPVR